MPHLYNWYMDRDNFGVKNYTEYLPSSLSDQEPRLDKLDFAYDKRDDFDFDIAKFAFLDGDVSVRAFYGVYISLEYAIMLRVINV